MQGGLHAPFCVKGAPPANPRPQECCAAIAKVFVERRNLAASLKDAKTIVGKLETVRRGVGRAPRIIAVSALPAGCGRGAAH